MKTRIRLDFLKSQKFVAAKLCTIRLYALFLKRLQTAYKPLKVLKTANLALSFFIWLSEKKHS
jgi:hypothetical protein